MTQQWEPDLRPSDAEYFLNLLDELRALSGLRATSYQAIRAAGLLRILLLDPPLVHRMKTATGLTPEYRVGVLNTMAELGEDDHVAVTGIMLDPEIERAWMAKTFPGAPPTVRLSADVLDLDSFLRRKVLISTTDPVTVKDVIKWYANELGGAHREHDGSQARRFPNIERRLPVWEPLFRQSIIAACRVVLQALRPMELELALASRPSLFGLDNEESWIPDGAPRPMRSLPPVLRAGPPAH